MCTVSGNTAKGFQHDMRTMTKTHSTAEQELQALKQQYQSLDLQLQRMQRQALRFKRERDSFKQHASRLLRQLQAQEEHSVAEKMPESPPGLNPMYKGLRGLMKRSTAVLVGFEKFAYRVYLHTGECYRKACDRLKQRAQKTMRRTTHSLQVRQEQRQLQRSKQRFEQLNEAERRQRRYQAAQHANLKRLKPANGNRVEAWFVAGSGR